MTEKLKDSLLPSAVSGSRMLNGETVNTAIVAADLQSSMATTDRANKVDVRQEPVNSYEVLVLILVL